MQIATILFPLVFALLGAFVYALSGPPDNPQRVKLQELARIMYFCGLFWLVYILAHVSLHL